MTDRPQAGQKAPDQQAPDQPTPDQQAGLLRRVLLGTVATLFVLLLAASRTQGIDIEQRPDLALTMFFAIKQDIPLAALALAALVGWWVRAGPSPALPAMAGLPSGRLRLSGRTATAILIVLALAAWAIRVVLFRNYDMSRDEQMVTFDATIFARGHLMQPIPAFWRQFYDALNVNFILPVGDREYWISGYLPGNAALRAVLGLVLPQGLAGGVLVGLGGLALWRIAGRLWPDSGSTRAVVFVLYVTSAQVVVSAATTFAMSAHMTANLVWLWLFLQRRPWTQAGAIAVGFIATGLHQPLFHPLFVGPFLLLLLRERAWKELAVYVAAYLAIGLFWIGWQPWLSAQGLHPVPADYSNDGANYIDRFRATFHPPDRWSLAVMAANLLRFAVWQNLALLPLAALGVITARRWDPLRMALWLGPLALVVFMTVVLPAQVNGWGYRYLAGFIGGIVLLAGFGWHWLELRGAAPGRIFAGFTALAVLVTMPIQVGMAARQIGAYARAAEAIRGIDADVVIVDEGVPFSGDLVNNRDDLSNRPILLSRSHLNPADLPVLCHTGRTLAFADAPLLGGVSAFFGLARPIAPTPWQSRLHSAAADAGCRIVPAAPAMPARK
jgi:hypothetical protein